MTLPIIETPKYDLTLPVSGKKIKYRPFLVKEQKVLLQAIEMGGEDQLANAIEDIAMACTFDQVKIHDLPFADVEYLILNIRKKSVGEIVELSYKCSQSIMKKDDNGNEYEGACNTKFTIPLNLNDVSVSKEELPTQIMLSESVGITLKQITYDTIKVVRNEKNKVDIGYKLILSSIDKIFDADQVYSGNDFDAEELIEFIDSLNTEQFEKIQNAVSKIPVLEHNISITCPKCGHKEEVKLSGINDFLD
jgi:hypothetical protein